MPESRLERGQRGGKRIAVGIRVIHHLYAGEKKVPYLCVRARYERSRSPLT